MTTSTWAVQVPTGYRVGPWEVTDGIATGSWGSVYAARHVAKHRAAEDFPAEAALKFLPTGTVTSRQLAHLAEMARREMRLHESLTHPRLVRRLATLKVDDEDNPDLDGAVVIVMERAVASLDDQLRRAATFPLPGAKRLLKQVCEGLAFMHSRGWVHGDLKPSNVLIMGDGSVRLTDFGLAAELEGTHAYLPPAGTPDYTPPERWDEPLTQRGTAIRPTADIWAFGVTAHVLFTGKSPFPGGTPSTRAAAAAAYAAGSGELRLSPHLPTGWRSLISDCLAASHEQRDRHEARSLLARIHNMTDGAKPSGHRRDRRHRRHRKRHAVAAVAGVATVVGVATAGALAANPFNTAGQARATAAPYASPSRAQANTKANKTPYGPPSRTPRPTPTSESNPKFLRTGVGIPSRYRKMIIEAGTSCREPSVSPALIAAILKVESDFDPDLSDPEKNEYGIARWTPEVLRYHLPDGQRDKVPEPPFSPEMSIAAVGRYLCFLGPRISPDLPQKRALLLAAAYRTSATKVNNAKGFPSPTADYVGQVRRYLAMYTP